MKWHTLPQSPVIVICTEIAFYSQTLHSDNSDPERETIRWRRTHCRLNHTEPLSHHVTVNRGRQSESDTDQTAPEERTLTVILLLDVPMAVVGVSTADALMLLVGGIITDHSSSA